MAGSARATSSSSREVRSERARFLFRTEEGTIDAPTWRFHTGWLLALFALLTAIWFVLRPYAHHDLATSQFIAPLTILAFAYLIIYAFLVLLIAISYVMLSMKRCHDRQLPGALASLVPLLALCAASLHFLRAQTPDVIIVPYVVALDIAFIAAAAWTAYELGTRAAHSRPDIDL